MEVIFFLLFVIFTVYVTYWAARKTKTTGEFYAAGRRITGLQNGLALSGDYMSAASFLGIAGMVSLTGYDGIIYAAGWLVGWPILLFLIAEPLRNLGKFTFADVLAFRLKQKPVRTAAAICSLLTILTYTIAQMVGAGYLIKLMFGIPYEAAVIIIGGVMLCYVVFGGMHATTLVQIIKTVLLLVGTTILLVLGMSHFGFSPGNLYAEVGKLYGAKMLEPGGFVASGIETISLGLALMFGLLGLPHILMRFFTVPDAKEARKSVIYATTFIGYFYCIIPIVGFCAAVLLSRDGVPGQYFISEVDKGGNMAAILLAKKLGGDALMGFTAAVAFATILAVVAGLTLAAASTMAHDIFVNVIKSGRATEREQVAIARNATIIFGVAAIFLGILFKNQNVAFMVGLAFAIASSGNFPALFLSIVWKRLSTTGAVLSILAGSISALSMIILSPTVWVEIFHKPDAVFPMRNPAIFSMGLAFAVAFIFSFAFPDKNRDEKFEDEKLRTYLGIGAE